MPMSPVTRHRLPAATRSRAISAPVTSAAVAWSRVIAGPSVKSAVPRRDLAGQQPGDRLEVGGHPHVDHRDLGAGLGRERVDHRPAGQEVGDHLGGHLLRPRADALRVHAVVGGEDRDAGRLGQRRRAAARQARPAAPTPPRARRASRAAWSSGPAVPARRPSPPASGGAIAAITSASGSTGSSPGSPRRPNSSACTAHDTGRRRAQPAVGEFRFGREPGHVAQAKIGDHLQVRGQPELGGELALVEEAHPADAEAFGPGGQPQVGHREHAGEIRGLRLDVAAERVPAAAGRGRR